MSESMFTSPRNETLFSSQLGPVADDERRKYEEERAKLYQQLDEKDDEIQVQSQLAERYRLELMEKVLSFIHKSLRKLNNFVVFRTKAHANTKSIMILQWPKCRAYKVLFIKRLLENPKLSHILEQLAKSKEETEELFSAIQEIHVNFEQKKTENAQLIAENEKMTNDINKK